MNTRILMVGSAGFMALLGLGASFFPQEILSYFNVQPEGIAVVSVSVIGALYLGFAGLNWMGRGNLIGGIYSRPVAIGNFIHFLMVAILLLKRLIATPYTTEFAVGAAFNATFAASFDYLLFVGGESCS